MKKEYRLNNIFNETGVTLNELISNFLISFLDKELGILNSNIKNTNIIRNI